MLPSIRLEPDSATPLYRQLYERIAALVRAGALAHGAKLPPTRELAGLLGLNRTTVSAAYELLESDGLIQGHVGRGSFVNYPNELRPASPQTATFSFASSRPSADHFPLADFQACCREAVSGPDVLSILQLGAPVGYAPLRRFLLESSRVEGSAQPEDDIAVTNGCQQALFLLARTLAPVGTPVIVEDPVYHGLKNVFAEAGARLIGVGCDQDGIDVDRVERALAAEQAKLIVVTPNFQNPTGGTIPLERRRALVRLAQDHGATLVENDLYGELRYEGTRLPSLKQLDESGRTVLIRSFSKIAFPGLRVGWVIGAPKLVADLAAARQLCDLHTDQLSQAVLWRFATSGRLASHLDEVRTAGRERLGAVLSACERHLPEDSRFTRPQGGMNLWLRLPEQIDSALLLPRAEREGVTYLPGRHFAVARPAPNALRISFAGLPPEKIETGISILGRVVREEIENSNVAGRYDATLALV